MLKVLHADHINYAEGFIPEKGRQRSTRDLLHNNLEISIFGQGTKILHNISKKKYYYSHINFIL